MDITKNKLINASKLPEWLEFIEDSLSEGAMKIDGFDDCICGIVERHGMDALLLYDTNTMIEKLMDKDGMDYEDAVEYFDFNIKGAWMGEGTPCFFKNSFL